MSFNRLTIALSLASLALLTTACATTEHAAPQTSKTAAGVPAGLTATPSGIVLLRPADGLLVSGQPAATDWTALAASGVRVVVNLRTAAELQGRDERAEVAAAGMRYVELPVAGAADLTTVNAKALSTLIAQAEGPVLVHCASGNRVGGLLAIAKSEAGMASEAALEFGRSAGMKSSETRAREVIEQERASYCARAGTSRDDVRCPAGD